MAGKRSDEQFDYLTVKDNVIDTGLRSISIKNISTVGITKVYPYQRFAFIVALISVGFFVAGSTANNANVLHVFALFALLASFGLYASNETFLVLSTNDGSSSLFFNKDMNFLKRVKQSIDERINDPESASQFTVNFNKGSIEQMSVDNMGGVTNMSAETVVSDSPGANVASHSAGAQVGIGNTMEVYSSFVDYQDYLPKMEEIRALAPQRRPDLNIEDKLDELIELMKNGSPTKEERRRVLDLTANLSQILQSYPTLVRLFDDLAAFVGRFI